MLRLATILDNPGEPPAETRYRDPAALAELGYDGLAVYSTTGLSGLLGADTLAAGDVRQWVADHFDHVEATIAKAHAAGLDAWLVYDAPSLARELVGSAMTCTRDERTLCPASEQLLDMAGECLIALLSHFDQVEGIVLRLGENDAHRTPYLVGNDIYAPRCSRCGGLSRADRLVRFISYFYDVAVNRLGRRLMVRAWNARPHGLHDSVELCREVVGRLPEDNQRLLLSFKFTQTDFWRYQQWNQASLVCGDRPIVYELECQREFEGKGAVPNYQPPLWRDGMPEAPQPMGLAEAAGRVNLAGLWAWVRGGGYGGPYVGPEAETWIDANVVAVPQLAADPRANLDELARHWITGRLGCDDPGAIEALHRALTHSTQTVLESFYIGPYASGRSDPWHPSGDFVQDDLIDAEAGWAIVRQLPDRVLDEVMAEKQRAVERIAGDRRALQQAAGQLPRHSGESVVHQMQYSESLVETLAQLMQACVAFKRVRRGGDGAAARSLQQAVHHCQSYWNHHQRYANFRGTATAFRSDNLWDLTQQMVEQTQLG